MFLNCYTAVSVKLKLKADFYSAIKSGDSEALETFVERLGLEGWTSLLVLVLKVWENGMSQSHLGLEGWPSRSCDLTSCGHACLPLFCSSLMRFSGDCDQVIRAVRSRVVAGTPNLHFEHHAIKWDVFNTNASYRPWTGEIVRIVLCTAFSAFQHHWPVWSYMTVAVVFNLLLFCCRQANVDWSVDLK